MDEVIQERQLDPIHHVAIAVEDIRQAIHFYSTHFRCKVEYQDESWALLEFGNIKLALVLREQHEPHLAFTSKEASRFGQLCEHRDGTRSVYIKDPSGNTIEIMDIE